MTASWIFFDFDNTLMGTERFTLPSLIKRFNDLYHFDMSLEYFHKHFHGLSYKGLCDAVAAHYAVPVDFAAVFHDREWAIMEMSRETGIPMADGVPEMLNTLKARGFQFGIATNNSLQRCMAALRYATNGRGEEVAAHFGTRMFQAGDAQKPRPDVYLHAMIQCGADPNHSIAVEDSVAGVTGAVAAGLKTYGYVGYADDQAVQEKKLLAAGAVACFNDWNAFPGLLVS